MPVNLDGPVVKVGVWHRAHPTVLNNFAPFCAEDVNGAGAGGADRRMNQPTVIISADSSLAVPFELPFNSRLVASSAEPLKMQPGTADRSFGNNSFETPCSTL